MSGILVGIGTFFALPFIVISPMVLHGLMQHDWTPAEWGKYTASQISYDDKTDSLVGIDLNQNGIRDSIETAIFIFFEVFLKLLKLTKAFFKT